MPWLSHVDAVLEAWYPGEEDGAAIAHILTGAFDPAGRLPITFPRSPAAQPLTSPAQFPGVDDEVNFGTGAGALDIGYRWYQAHEVAPLFPFGFGLSYTHFGLSDASIQRDHTNVVVHLTVTNTGRRSGVDVVQVYVGDPPSVHEPPEQLRAFTRVTLGPSQSRPITLTVPLASLDVYLNGELASVPGNYLVSVGQSSSDLPITQQVRVP